MANSCEQEMHGIPDDRSGGRMMHGGAAHPLANHCTMGP